ncbi:L-histidine N(alpha)-methyltransferase [Agaribacterium sp. ZY112]|uniref:L-histidine N(alpha)-methyltransferase n=1 Tax=Agaribacterium sp. ZY112 TaxID=3233574 RepID=UPI0035232C67
MGLAVEKLNVEAEKHRSKCEQCQSLDPEFLQDVWQGLSENKKRLSPKYFYDERGSQFFDDICALAEYYPYRTELTMLPEVAKQLVSLLDDDLTIVEFGAGSLIKIRPLLKEMKQVRSFIPVDVSGEHLYQSARALRHEFPDVRVKPHVADMCAPGQLPSTKHKKMGFFPGSTIGNFDAVDAVQFLKSVRESLGAEAKLLIGVDTKKSPAILHRAYNDQRGITASFNLNVLRRLNNELDSDIDLRQFEHYAFYNASQGCIEMHLVSTCYQEFSVAGRSFSMHAGESIHTENSYKYTPEQFQHLAAQAGWQIQEKWLADGDMFSIFLLSAD